MSQQWDQGINQKVPWNKWKWGHKNPKLVWQWESNTKREVYIGSRQSQKTRRSSNKPSHLTFKGTWKRTTNKAETEKKGGKNKIRAEINERESLKKWYKISMNPRASSLKR